MNYIYIGDTLQYCPMNPRKEARFDRRTKSLIRGTGGLFVHPSLRPRGYGSKSLTKQTLQELDAS